MAMYEGLNKILYEDSHNDLKEIYTLLKNLQLLSKDKSSICNVPTELTEVRMEEIDTNEVRKLGWNILSLIEQITKDVDRLKTESCQI